MIKRRSILKFLGTLPVIGVLIKPISNDVRLIDGGSRLLVNDDLDKANHAQEQVTTLNPCAEIPLGPVEMGVRFEIPDFFEGYNPIQSAKIIHRLTARYSMEELSQLTGKSKPWLKAHLNLLNLVPEMQESIAAGRFNVSWGNYISTIEPNVQRAYAKVLMPNKKEISWTADRSLNS